MGSRQVLWKEYVQKKILDPRMSEKKFLNLFFECPEKMF